MRALLIVVLGALVGATALSAADAEPAVTPPARAAAVGASAAGRALSGPRRPPIRLHLIPYGARRRHEMAAYSRRHYGHATSRLAHPRVIVEHVAQAGSARAVYDTFAPDHADPELHERPNVCSHFVIGSDGTIAELVPVTLMCRHTVGLNDVAIGIEHAGFSDADVLGNQRELRASLRLTAWLRCRYRIALRNVIGHNESLASPFHHERVRALRTQTHGDMRHASMVRYRRGLARIRCTPRG